MGTVYTTALFHCCTSMDFHTTSGTERQNGGFITFVLGRRLGIYRWRAAPAVPRRTPHAGRCFSSHHTFGMTSWTLPRIPHTVCCPSRLWLDRTYGDALLAYRAANMYLQGSLDVSFVALTYHCTPTLAQTPWTRWARQLRRAPPPPLPGGTRTVHSTVLVSHLDVDCLYSPVLLHPTICSYTNPVTHTAHAAGCLCTLAFRLRLLHAPTCISAFPLYLHLFSQTVAVLKTCTFQCQRAAPLQNLHMFTHSRYRLMTFQQRAYARACWRSKRAFNIARHFVRAFYHR